MNDTDDFLKRVFNWAFSGLEGCDESEWRLFRNILFAIWRYQEENGEEHYVYGE